MTILTCTKPYILNAPPLLDDRTATTSSRPSSSYTSAGPGLPPLELEPATSSTTASGPSAVKQFVPPTKESILADRAKAEQDGKPKAKRVVPLIEVLANDRLGGKGETETWHESFTVTECADSGSPNACACQVRVKCSPKDTIGDLKKLIAAQKGTKPEKIVLKKWYNIYKDHIKLEDYGEPGLVACFLGNR